MVESHTAAEMEEVSNFVDYLGIKLLQAMKSAIVALLFIFGLLMFGAVLWKTLLLAAGVAAMHFLRLGSGRLTQLAVLMAILGGLFWIDIIPLHRWSNLAAIKIETALKN